MTCINEPEGGAVTVDHNEAISITRKTTGFEKNEPLISTRILQNSVSFSAILCVSVETEAWRGIRAMPMTGRTMMTISATVEQHLADAGIAYNVIPHDHTSNSISTAKAAHVSVDAMVKAVVLKDAKGYLMAVMPATYRLSESEIYDVLGRRVELAGEDELADIFADCDPGAVPPLAAAYDMEAVWDDSLANLKEIYFEGGDHDHVVRVSGADFRNLMGNARHAHFSHHM